MIYVLIGYMWLFIHRPFEVWPVLAALRIERIYMVLTLLYWASVARRYSLSNSLKRAIACFSVAVVLCWLASPWSSQLRTQVAVENYLKQLLFFFLLVTSVADAAELKKLIIGFVGAMGLYLAHSLREYQNGRMVYRMGITRMVGVDQSLRDPNSFGATIDYALPFVAVVWVALPGRKSRMMLVGYLVLSVMCVILTGSRSSFSGLLFYLFILLVRSRHRFRLLILTMILLPIGWRVIPPQMQNRFYTLIDPSVGPKNAQESAEARSQGWSDGRKLLETYPMTGCGPGAWRFATGSLVESHLLYGQVIGEMGLLGIFTFVPVVALLLWNARWIKTTYRQHPEWDRDFLYEVGEAVGSAVMLLLFLGFAGHNLFRYSWLWYAGFVIIARHCVQQRLDLPDEYQGVDEIGTTKNKFEGGTEWTVTHP